MPKEPILIKPIQKYPIYPIRPIRPFPPAPIPEEMEFYPSPDRQEYQLVKNGIIYHGKTGRPMVNLIEKVEYS